MNNTNGILGEQDINDLFYSFQFPPCPQCQIVSTAGQPDRWACRIESIANNCECLCAPPSIVCRRHALNVVQYSPNQIGRFENVFYRYPEQTIQSKMKPHA